MRKIQFFYKFNFWMKNSYKLQLIPDFPILFNIIMGFFIYFFFFQFFFLFQSDRNSMKIRDLEKLESRWKKENRGGTNRKRKNEQPGGISEAKIKRKNNGAGMKKEKQNPGGKRGAHEKGKTKSGGKTRRARKRKKKKGEGKRACIVQGSIVFESFSTV